MGLHALAYFCLQHCYPADPLCLSKSPIKLQQILHNQNRPLFTFTLNPCLPPLNPSSTMWATPGTKDLLTHALPTSKTTMIPQTRTKSLTAANVSSKPLPFSVR
ncbi:hypothetical protein N7G274_003097 [Stereocaulon virgatum]|uniref:Uncharacterized protein n=1 Tax=Stereocaulon virgatum TaxID=373712 RepID=A0ABR4AEY3_9LECA